MNSENCMGGGLCYVRAWSYSSMVRGTNLNAKLAQARFDLEVFSINIFAPQFDVSSFAYNNT